MVSGEIQGRAERMVFDATWLEDLTEKRISEHACESVEPLVNDPGRVLLTSQRLYFQPLNPVTSHPVFKYRLSALREVHKRRHVLRHTALELVMSDDSSALFNLPATVERDMLYDALVSLGPPALSAADPGNATLRWQNGLMSNFDYLMHVNHLAGRTVNDISQYPVFPWVLADYASAELDLADPAAYRDLSKPVGALEASRLRAFRERFREMPEPKFLYGTHYSTPGYVLSFLVRTRPELMLKLQGGTFDKPDRLFRSVPETWASCAGKGASQGDVRELIPEFYARDPEFLVNTAALDLGVTQANDRVDDVALPPWAHGNPSTFLAKMREALEGPIVSASLHHWIDLVFGVKQRGEAAVEADNVFFHLTYEGAVDLDALPDAEARAGMEAQIREFGQTPTQVFAAPHPARNSGGGTSSVLASASAFGGSNSTNTSTNTTTNTTSTPYPSSSLLPMNASQNNPSSFGDHARQGGHDGTYDTTAANISAATTTAVTGAAGAGGDGLGRGLGLGLGLGGGGSDGGVWRSAPFARHVNSGTHRLHREKVTAICVSPVRDPDSGGPVIFTTSSDSLLKMVALVGSSTGDTLGGDTGDDSGAPRQVRSVAMGQLALSSCAVSADGGTVVAGSWDNSVYLYSVEFGRITDAVHAHDDAVGCLCRRGDMMLTGGWDATIKLWRCEPGGPERAPHAELLEHETEVTCIDAVPECGVAASGSQDGMIVVWDLAMRCSREVIHADTAAITALRLSSDGRRIFTTSLSGCLKIHESTGAQIWATDCGTPLHCLETDGVHLICGGGTGSIAVYRVADGEHLGTLRSADLASPIHSLAVVDGDTIVAGCNDGNIRIWTAEEGSH
jgi:factor associated with neutral sphingomyelinase activation